MTFMLKGENAIAIGPERLVELLRGLTDQSPSARSEWSETVTDWRRSFSVAEAAAVSYTLACLATIERDHDCREAQLNALAELAEWDLASRAALEQVKALDRDSLVGSEVEHYEYLLSRLAEAAPPAEGDPGR